MFVLGKYFPGPADLDGDFSVSTPPMASSGLGLVRFNLTVVAINTIRMAMMGISEEHYFLIHGTVGSTFISWVLCLWGTRSDWTSPDFRIRLRGVYVDLAHLVIALPSA